MGVCCSSSAETIIAHLQHVFDTCSAEGIVTAVHNVVISPGDYDAESTKVRSFVNDFVVTTIMTRKNDHLAIELMKVLAKWGRGRQYGIQDVVAAAARRRAGEAVRFVATRAMWAVLPLAYERQTEEHRGLDWTGVVWSMLRALRITAGAPVPLDERTMEFIALVLSLVDKSASTSTLCPATSYLFETLMGSNDPAAPKFIGRLMQASPVLRTTTMYKALLTLAVSTGNKRVVTELASMYDGSLVPWEYLIAVSMVTRNTAAISVKWMLAHAPQGLNVYSAMLHALCRAARDDMDDPTKTARECLQLLDFMLDEYKTPAARLTLFRAALVTPRLHPVAEALYDPVVVLPTMAALLPRTFGEFLAMRDIFGWKSIAADGGQDPGFVAHDFTAEMTAARIYFFPDRTRDMHLF